MAKIEAQFLMILKKSFEYYGAFFYKMPDMPHFKGAMTQFDVKKPFDAIACYKGIPIAVEAKAMTDYKSFGLKDLRPNQKKGLELFEKAGGLSFVFLNVKRSTDYETGARRCNQMLIFPWSELKHREKNYFKEELIERWQTPFHHALYPGVFGFLQGISEYVDTNRHLVATGIYDRDSLSKVLRSHSGSHFKRNI